MIILNLNKLIKKLEQKTGRKITLKEVSEGSGCDNNAMSRIVNHPEMSPSLKVLDKLIEFFWSEFRPFEDGKRDAQLILEVMSELISFYPSAFVEVAKSKGEGLADIQCLWRLIDPIIPKDLVERLGEM